MNERQLQFRVGLFVIVASIAAAGLVFQFGKISLLWNPRYTVEIHFDAAPGVYPSTPVRRNGIPIGKVQDVIFSEKDPGVTVRVDIREDVRLREDAVPEINRTLLGDSSIEFTPGTSRKFLRPGARINGRSGGDAMEVVNRLETRLTATLDSFQATSREWQQVGHTLNGLLETNHGNLNLVIERAAVALHEFTITMQNADAMLADAQKVIGDPQNQENLRRTLSALPELVAETRQTVEAVKRAVLTADQTLGNLNEVTTPLADRSASIVTKLDGTLGNLESLSRELNEFAQLVNKEDGSLQRFAADPELYRNLNLSATTLAVVLKNLEPIVRDMRIFSDKIARHPEIMGVGGMMRGSSGLKDPVQDENIQQSGYQRPPAAERR